jgi:hypothetical protein
VRRRACRRIREAVPCDGVVHVRLVVRRVKILAVPASSPELAYAHIKLRGTGLLTRGSGE